jgi:hypothetical protein
MTTKNKSVSTATVERLLKINQNNQKLTTRSLPPPPSPSLLPPSSPLGLKDLIYDVRYKISRDYNDLVNKPQIIANELIEVIQSDFENETDKNKVDSERDKAKIILEPITDINIIDEIRQIINDINYKKSLGYKYFSIFYLIQEKFIELVIIKNEKQKLKDLNDIVKILESQFTKIKENIQSQQTLNRTVNRTSNRTTIQNLINNVDTIFLKIKEEQDKANKILTRNYLKTLIKKNISDKQRIIEGAVKEVEDNVKKELDKANNLLEQIKFT